MLKLLVYTLIFFLPLRNVVAKVPNLFGVPGLGLTNLFFLALYIVFLVSGSRSDAYPKKLTVPILGYILMTLLCAFTTDPNLYSRADLIIFWKDQLLLVSIYFIAAAALNDRRSLYVALVLMVLATFYMDSFFYRWIRWFNLDSFADKIKKVNGTFHDLGGCNEWAAFFSTYTLVLLPVALRVQEKKWRLLLLGLVSANIMVLLFTFSRGAYLAFLCGLLWLLLLLKKPGWLVLLLVLSLSYNTILPAAVIERVEMSFAHTESGDMEDNDVVDRLVMWKQAKLLIAQSPLIGQGLFSFRYEHWNNPHNQHLNMFVQGGIILYFFFLWIFFTTYREARRLRRVAVDPVYRAAGIGMCAATVSLFVANMFGDRWTYFPLIGYFWLLNGMVHSMISLSLSPKTSEATGAPVFNRLDPVQKNLKRDCRWAASPAADSNSRSKAHETH